MVIIPVGTGLIPDKTGFISHFQALSGDESPRQRERAPRIRRKNTSHRGRAKKFKFKITVVASCNGRISWHQRRRPTDRRV